MTSNPLLGILTGAAFAFVAAMVLLAGRADHPRDRAYVAADGGGPTGEAVR